MRVLVLGATGMLGSAVFRDFSLDPALEVWGTMRDAAGRSFFPRARHDRLLTDADVLSNDTCVGVLGRVQPSVIINCVGVVKQRADANDPLVALPTNSLFPHRLARLCALSGARVVHISTDCVFSGRTGGYSESDEPDADDLYGRSKLLGELSDYPNAITLRTSMIGHELRTKHGVVEWFLASTTSVKGFAKAIFSGLTTVELARLIRMFVLPHPELTGVYHVSVAPISKLDLLTLVATTYGSATTITPDAALVIDRSLNSDRFRRATGYIPPSWPDLIATMYGSRSDE